MKHFGKRFLALALTLLLCFGSMLAMTSTAADNTEVLNISVADLTWSMNTLDGKTINQDSFTGKTLLFVFYSSNIGANGKAESSNSGNILSGLANSEWAGRDDIQIIAADAKNNDAATVAKFKELYAPDCDNMIFALNGSNLMWNLVRKQWGSVSITYTYCAVVKDKVLKCGWQKGGSASECREAIAAVLGETGTVVTRGLKVESHSAKEIKEFAASHPASITDPITYKVQPSLSGTYSAGVLSDETAESAVNMLNQVRYIAGLGANVTWDDTYADLASSGTLLNYLNNTLSHYPDRPSVLSSSAYDELYDKGYTGASSSNIASGYSTLTNAILNGWMADDDSSNISKVGHRRWFLSLDMETIGFGATGRYTAAHVTQSSWRGSGDYVAWPAQNMPVQYFSSNYPWSVSLGNKNVSTDNVTVELTRRSDGKSWSFSGSSSDGDFYVSVTNSGSPACIIFRPKALTSIAVGDEFDVVVTFPDSIDTIRLEYTVSFFDLNEPELIVGDINNDGTVDVNDVREFKLSLAGVSELNVADIAIADINGDGKINAADYIELKKLIVA